MRRSCWPRRRLRLALGGACESEAGDDEQRGHDRSDHGATTVRTTGGAFDDDGAAGGGMGAHAGGGATGGGGTAGGGAAGGGGGGEGGNAGVSVVIGCHDGSPVAGGRLRSARSGAASSPIPRQSSRGNLSTGSESRRKAVERATQPVARSSAGSQMTNVDPSFASGRQRHAAAVTLDDLAHDREAEPAAALTVVGFGLAGRAPEPIEHRRLVLRPRSRVLRRRRTGTPSRRRRRPTR